MPILWDAHEQSELHQTRIPFLNAPQFSVGEYVSPLCGEPHSRSWHTTGIGYDGLLVLLLRRGRSLSGQAWWRGHRGAVCLHSRRGTVRTIREWAARRCSLRSPTKGGAVGMCWYYLYA